MDAYAATALRAHTQGYYTCTIIPNLAGGGYTAPTRRPLLVALAMVAGHVCYLHFTAIRGICEVDPCSPVHTFFAPGVGAMVAPSERNFDV